MADKTIDPRLLDADCVEKIEENFNRVLALIDAIGGDEGALAALGEQIAALDDRVTALEGGGDDTPAADPGE